MTDNVNNKFKQRPTVRRLRGFMSLQLANLLGVGAVVAGLGFAVWLQTLRADAAESRAVVAEQSMHAAMAASAAERRARQQVEAERDRVEALVLARDRDVRRLRASLDQQQRDLEEADDDACPELARPLCPAVARLLRGGDDGGGTDPGGGAGAAAALADGLPAAPGGAD